MARPTGATAAGVAQLQPYGFSILAAIRAGAKVTDLWNTVYSAGYVGGAGGATIFDMNFVAGRWRAVSNAMDAFAAAHGTPANQIVGSMIADAPWAGFGESAAISPQYQIRFASTVTNNGVEYPVYSSLDWLGSLTGYTTDDVLNAAQDSLNAIASGEKYPSRPAEEAPPYVGGVPGTVDPASIQILRV